MKTVARMELKPDMILGEDVSYNGSVIYPAGTKLDEFIIERLKRYSVMCVSVMEKIDLATTKYEKLLYTDTFIAFCSAYSETLRQYKKLMLQFVNFGVKPSDDELFNLYYGLSAHIPEGFALLDYFYSMMPNEDELTFTHCLNTALMAGKISEWFQMNEEAKKTLILCGFYYDIGKLRLPYDILWKSGKLTDEERKLVNTHPEIGYQMVLNSNIRQHVKNSILMHHERMDGSGYPYGILGDRIDIYAKYIAIIDSYTAMAAPRSYRSALAPLQILEIFQKDLTRYDAAILLPIMDKIASAQIGEKIRLSDESSWEIFMINKNNYSRPLLKNEKNEFLDLALRNDLKII